MAKSFTVPVNVVVLKYAIENSGYTYDQIEKKLEKGKKRPRHGFLQDIVNGSSKLKYGEFKKIDSYLKRGLPFYFLESPPKEVFLKSFRQRHPNAVISPSVEIELREYQNIREEIGFLTSEIEAVKINLQKSKKLKDNSQRAATELRELLQYHENTFIDKTTKETFSYLRTKIESMGVYVFKNHLEYGISGAILLSGNLVPLIILNSTDDKCREIFTLLHEVGHYLLDIEEIDQDGDNSYPEDEEWCNNFAYSFLISPETERQEAFVRSNKAILTSDVSLKNLSEKYKVSKLAFMYRFSKLGIIDNEEYQEYKSRHPYKVKRQKEKSSGGDWHNTQRDRLSKSFVELVKKNYSAQSISTSETMGYLGIKDVHRIQFYFGGEK